MKALGSVMYEKCDCSFGRYFAFKWWRRRVFYWLTSDMSLLHTPPDKYRCFDTYWCILRRDCHLPPLRYSPTKCIRKLDSMFRSWWNQRENHVASHRKSLHTPCSLSGSEMSYHFACGFVRAIAIAYYDNTAWWWAYYCAIERPHALASWISSPFLDEEIIRR